MRNLKTSPALLALLKKSARDFAALPIEQQDEILRKQREGYVRAELSWPKDCPYR